MELPLAIIFGMSQDILWQKVVSFMLVLGLPCF